jgi:tetratricopeptide (TPR) repeat protein
LWESFGKLIQHDTDGGTLWGVIEDADTYENFDPGLELLQKAADSMPDAYEPLAAYVRALITLGRHAEAAAAIPRLHQTANDDYSRAETAQLSLESAAPDFEEAYGELVDEIEAGELPNSDSIGLLTDALAREPAFADGAVTLAQCYQLHDQAELALQTLNAAREVLPEHLELVLSIADVLWSIDEDDQALGVMQDALAKHPDDVAILARFGEYYFEIGEDDKARELLRRAEALEPRHPELMRVREEIALEMAGMDDDQDGDAVNQ